jgi:DNA-binding CsgD family transcriptional regulator/catechol 2,3-dioxygenase-like lactoylglutathione lyase family enzyme
MTCPDILTPAEWQVTNLVRHGASNAEIAELRGTSRDATKFHVANAREKAGVASRAALADWDGVPADSAMAQRESSAMSDANLGPIGQIAREVSDVPRSEAWYRDVLGLPHLFTFGHLAFFLCGETRLMLTRPESGAVQPQSVLYFRVSDIRGVHRTLAERGATFRGAPHLIHRHGDGTEEWMAFFEDPDGHLLALMEQVKPLPR